MFFNYLIYHLNELRYYIRFQFTIHKGNMTIMFSSIIIFKSQFLSTLCEVPQLDIILKKIKQYHNFRKI